MKLKIVITGIAGFIGYHLALKLKSEGYNVVGFDNFNDYYDPELKFARSRELRNNGIHVGSRDLKVPFEVESFMQIERPELVIHLAAMAGVRHSMDDPGSYIQNNIVGTHNLIEAMKKADIKNAIYASTSCVMAGNELPWNESDKLYPQLNPYGYTKATTESMFYAEPSLEYAIGLRFFTVYGPWGRPDMALFSFTKNIIEGKPITLFNNGDMIRDFTYIDDIVQGINILVGQKTFDSNREIFNIGYGEQVPLMRFVEAIENNLGRKAITEFAPKHPADTQATWSDTTKLQKLGYNPTTSIEEGVEKFVTWYKNYYGVN